MQDVVSRGDTIKRSAIDKEDVCEHRSKRVIML